MAKKRHNQQEEEGIELLENPDAISERIDKVEDYFTDKKNRNVILTVGGIIAALVLAVIFFKYYQTNQEQEADREIMQAIFYFESDSLNKALNGDGNYYGFLDVISKYGGTDAGNLARYYTGAIYMRKQNYENALRYLKEFDTDEDVLEAHSKALLGDVYSELGQHGEAVNSYSEAVEESPEDSDLAPLYLSKLAIAQEANSNLTAARDTYRRIERNYKQSTFYQDARKHGARLEGMIAQ